MQRSEIVGDFYLINTCPDAAALHRGFGGNDAYVASSAIGGTGRPTCCMAGYCNADAENGKVVPQLALSCWR